MKCSNCNSSVKYGTDKCNNCGKVMTSDDNHGDPIFPNTGDNGPDMTCSNCGSSVKYGSYSCPNCKKTMTSDDNYGDPIFR